jgi:hypothetical protein
VSEIDFPFAIRSRPITVQSDAEAFSRIFREGETIIGKVIGRIDPQHVVLRLKGHNLLVETVVPLTEQEEKTFQVEVTAPRVILRLLPERTENSSPADWLKKVISCDVPGEDLVEPLSGFWKTNPEAFPPGLRETVSQFLKLLHAFSMEELFQTPDSLREATARSGLFLEHKLKQWVEGDLNETVASLLKGDLKGLLLRLRSELKTASPPFESQEDGVQAANRSTMEALGKGVDQLLQKLELVQLLNIVQSDPQEKMFLFLPLWFENQSQFLELNISLPRRGSRGHPEEHVSILFLLHLPQWGRVTIDVTMRGKSLSCQFRVTDPEVSKFIKPFLSDLKTRLDNLGFESALHLSTEPPDPVTSSLITQLGEEVRSLVSIVV